MRIGILEWICGGGLQETDPTQITESLLEEGRAMLSSVAQDCLSCGHEVMTSVDSDLLEKLHLLGSDSGIQMIRSTGFTNELPSSWWKIASDADAVVVIAPEFSSILENAISELSPACKLLLNCRGDFLANACDKWLTAQRLKSAAIHHPETQLVCDVDNKWLEQHRCESGRWIIKPRDGAGCDAIQLVDDNAVRDALTAVRTSDSNSRMLIQPLHDGSAFSRSAIVDSAGCAHWLPLVTQEFSVSDSMSYRGGKVLGASESPSIEQLNRVLDATVAALGPGALGWIGVDLLYGDELNEWMVIEVNPRLTTSFTGLSESYGSGLLEQMLRAARGMDIVIKPNWKSVAFDASGNVSRSPIFPKER